MTSRSSTASTALGCSPTCAAGARLVAVEGWMSLRVLRRCGYFVAESRCERSLGDWGSDGRLYVRAWWKQEQSRISDLCRVDASQERSALPNDSIICWAAS